MAFLQTTVAKRKTSTKLFGFFFTAVQNYDESCQLPKWLHDVSTGIGFVYENLNGTKKYHIHPRSIVITNKQHHEHVG